MVQFFIGFGTGIFISIAIVSLLMAFGTRSSDERMSNHRHIQDRDYDRESRIAAARLRDFQERDMER